jgi:hypothetical protein
VYNDYNYDYNYGNYNLDSSASAGIAAGFLVFYIIYMILVLAISVVQIIGMWKTFKKAGKQGWEAIVPFYNIWTLFEISGYPGAYMFFAFIPCAGPIILLVFEIMAAISLSKKFNKSGGFAALLILVPVVGYCILGFGNDEYDASLGDHKNQKEETTTVDTTAKSTGDKFCGNCGTKVAKNAKHCSNCGKEL